MNPIAVVLQIITGALSLAPVALSTVHGIKALLAKDPNVPADLAAILDSTAADNAATLKAIQEWMDAHP